MQHKNYGIVLKKIVLYPAWLWALLILAGCRYGLPSAEIRDMQNLQHGWKNLMTSSEVKFKDITDRHNAFMEQLQDTSNYLQRVRIAQDTLLQMHIVRLKTNFESAMRRHIYNLKALQSFLVANDAWLIRINSEGIARQLARRSWQAKTTRFKSYFARIQESELAFQDIIPDYERISRALPGLTMENG